MAMAGDRLSLIQRAFGFEYEEGHGEQNLTALAGIALLVLVQAFRSLGSAGQREAERVHQAPPAGFDEVT